MSPTTQTTQTTGRNDFSNTETYVVEARFENVGSLKKRSPVAMSGVTIGRVTDIRFDGVSLEAVVTLAIFVVAMIVQMILLDRLGFVRLLGIAHAPWLALVPWAWYQSQALPEGSSMRIWLITLVVLNTGSLLIDTADVVRYLRGEREPHLTIGED